MTRPLLLDLFSGAGGCAVGYSRAGFNVVGVDHVPQPRYPFKFIEADALDFLRGLIAGASVCGYYLSDFSAIHASPPCQAYSPLKSMLKQPDNHPELIDPTRKLLEACGLPWVIENVMGARMGRNVVVLCGEYFGLRVVRHRQFETSFFIFQPSHPRRHKAMTSMQKRRKCFEAGMNISVTGDVGNWVGPACMGIDWMSGKELSQSIPPAYTEHIGKALLASLT